jgi:hypothetical protein
MQPTKIKIQPPKSEPKPQLLGGLLKLVKVILGFVKPYLRWMILGGTLFFLAANFRKHWQEISEIDITSTGWTYLGLALIVTLSAHVWSAFVWLIIVKEFKQPIRPPLGITTLFNY